jgi:Ca2+-binding EF-hand superfamily protein
MRLSLFAIPAAVLVLSNLTAQAPAQKPVAAQPAAETKPKSEPVVVREYDETRSTALFTACDSNGDDRIDVFEARAAFESVGAPNEIQWFRRLDQDRDGFLEWPEFDRFYRDLIKSGNALQLTLSRNLQASADVAVPLANQPLRETIRLFDKDQDKSLDRTEATAMLRTIGAPPQALSMLTLLDKDRDGKLSEADLAPHWEALRASVTAAQAKGAQQSDADAMLAALDLDANGTVSLGELARSLRRVDPQMERWAPQILQAADANKDGVLQAAELPALKKEPAQGMVERSARR